MNLYNNLLIKPRAMGVTLAPCGLDQDEKQIPALLIFAVGRNKQLLLIMMSKEIVKE